jgi:hypothetical protein
MQRLHGQARPMHDDGAHGRPREDHHRRS